jgi:hypothetical protein
VNPGRTARASLALAAVLLAAPAQAGEVQFAPFAGLGFGGYFQSPVYDARFTLDASADFGATLDVAFADTWRVEALFSHQSTELRAGRGVVAPAFKQTVERYMVGIVEEFDSDTRWRFFGVGLLGATRFDPGLNGIDSELRFAAGVSLGTKFLASRRLGLRFEGRVFYTVVESGGSAFCNGQGTCFFNFSVSGIWQGDVTGALILRF